jgi:hypothetical protein
MSPVYSRLKDIDDKWIKSWVIYGIPCAGDGILLCVMYVGQTIQYLKERIADHKRDVTLYEKAKAKNDRDEMERLADKSVIVNHIHMNHHNFDFDNTSILMQASDRYKLNYLEMFMIQKKLHLQQTH